MGHHFFNIYALVCVWPCCCLSIMLNTETFATHGGGGPTLFGPLFSHHHQNGLNNNFLFINDIHYGIPQLGGIVQLPSPSHPPCAGLPAHLRSRKRNVWPQFATVDVKNTFPSMKKKKLNALDVFSLIIDDEILVKFLDN